MNHEIIWAMYYASVCGMQFHPRNTNTTPDAIVEWAAKIADGMLEQHKERFPWGSSPQQS